MSETYADAGLERSRRTGQRTVLISEGWSMSISQGREDGKERDKNSGRKGKSRQQERTQRRQPKPGPISDAELLGPDFADQIEEQVSIYASAYRPRDHYEWELVRSAAHNGLRHLALTYREMEEASVRMRDAVKHWDARRSEEVVTQLSRLRSHPEESVLLLRRTSHGCRALLVRWGILGASLSEHGWLDELECRHLMRLLGESGEPHEAASLALRALWDAARLLRLAYDPSAEQVDESGHLNPGELEDARIYLAETIAAQAEELEALADKLWNQYDKPSRDAAPSLAYVDFSPAGQRLHRDMENASRARHRALEDLRRYRRTGEKRIVATKSRPGSTDRSG